MVARSCRAGGAWLACKRGRLQGLDGPPRAPRIREWIRTVSQRCRLWSGLCCGTRLVGVDTLASQTCAAEVYGINSCGVTRTVHETTRIRRKLKPPGREMVCGAQQTRLKALSVVERCAQAGHAMPFTRSIKQLGTKKTDRNKDKDETVSTRPSILRAEIYGEWEQDQCLSWVG